MANTATPGEQIQELVDALEAAYPELVKLAKGRNWASRLIATLTEYSEDVDCAEYDRLHG